MSVLASAAFVAAAAWLPDPLAVHWGWDGRPDGFLDRGAVVVIALLGGASLLVAALVLRWSAIGLWSTLGIGMGIEAGLLAANLGQETAVGSQVPAIVPVALMIGGSIGGMVVGSALDRRGREAESPDVARAAWVGTARSRWLPFGPWTALLAFGALAALPNPMLARLNLLMLGVLTTFGGFAIGRLEVVAGPKGIRVGFGPWGWPAVRVPLDAIAAADVTDRMPRLVRGWRVRPGRTYLHVRQGEGLVLELRDGRDLTVSVDRAAEAADHVNRLIDEASAD